MTSKFVQKNFSQLNGIFNRPDPLNAFARQKMAELVSILGDYEHYNCPPCCHECCYGSILMSYTEFSAIILYLQENWSPVQIRNFMTDKVGILKDDGLLLCPFLQPEAPFEHCCIYPVRPLVCRVFGTTAAPCTEKIEPSFLPEGLFNLGYHLLYYCGSQFIALKLNNNWALFEAPFALWCLADNSEADRLFLYELLQKKGQSFHAVLFDCRDQVFFTLQGGEKTVLAYWFGNLGGFRDA